jgi:hypothetical protein
MNMVETWFGIIITRQAIRRGAFTSVKMLIKQIRDHISHWNTADEILAEVALTQTNTVSSSPTIRSKSNRITRHQGCAISHWGEVGNQACWGRILPTGCAISLSRGEMSTWGLRLP